MKKFKKVLYVIILVLQLGGFIAVGILQDLTDKKAGVMHHIYARRYQWQNSYFSKSNLRLYTILLLAVGLLLLGLLIINIRKKQSIFFLSQIILGIFLSFLSIFIIKSKYFFNLLSYNYFIIASVIALGLQLTIILFTLNFYKQEKIV